MYKRRWKIGPRPILWGMLLSMTLFFSSCAKLTYDSCTWALSNAHKAAKEVPCVLIKTLVST